MEFDFVEGHLNGQSESADVEESKAAWGSGGGAMDAALQKALKDNSAELYAWAGSFKVTLNGCPPSEGNASPTRGIDQTMNEIDAFLNKGEANERAGLCKKRKGQNWTEQFQGGHQKIQALAANQALLERTSAQRHGRSGDEDREPKEVALIHQVKQGKVTNARRGQGGSPEQMAGAEGNQAGWRVEDLDIDLGGELSNGSYNMSEALMSLPALTVFKQEVPSPTGGARNNVQAASTGGERGAQQLVAGALVARGPQWTTQIARQQHAMTPNIINMGGNPRLNDQQDGNMMQKSSDSPDGNPSAGGGNNQEHMQNGNNPMMAIQHAHMNHYENAQNSAQHSVDVNCSPSMLLAAQTNSSAVQPSSNASFMSISHVATVLPANLPQHHTFHIQTQPGQAQGEQLPKNAISSADKGIHDDMRFQYVLAAATSIATKNNEETLTYLNQGQPYEIRLKKLGDLSHYRGKILKSVIRICFHERRLQYMEREQMNLWHNERPGERIVEVDVPLSYGLIQVLQPNSPAHLNTVEVLWDPMKEAGVYIKVNCISTEFTAKKHGGEKGVPFRVQVETYFPRDNKACGATANSNALAEDKRLHAAACQIKVFKLKGADRKHKQDREKVLRRPLVEQDKFQPSYECTVLTTLSNDALLPPPSIVKSQPYSPTDTCNPTPSGNEVLEQKPMIQLVTKAALPQANSTAALLGPVNVSTKHHSSDESDSKSGSPGCHSPSSDHPLENIPDGFINNHYDNGLSASASLRETVAWLTRMRFGSHQQILANFSAADLLRLTRDDLIHIIGLPDGIRLFNALRAKRIEPRLTIFARGMDDVDTYTAIYLHSYTANELRNKLTSFVGAQYEVSELYVSPISGARIRITDEVIRHMRDETSYVVRAVKPRQGERGSALLLIPTEH